MLAAEPSSKEQCSPQTPQPLSPAGLSLDVLLRPGLRRHCGGAFHLWAPKLAHKQPSKYTSQWDSTNPWLPLYGRWICREQV